MAAWAGLTGHSLAVSPTSSGRRWRVTCECGYNVGPTTPTCRTEAQAWSKGLHHFRSVAERLRANGVPVT